MADTCKNCGDDCVSVTPQEFETMRKQVADIHAFIEGLAGALNNPMVRAMMPPNMRGFIGGN